jgi:hypothetical protein
MIRRLLGCKNIFSSKVCFILFLILIPGSTNAQGKTIYLDLSVAANCLSTYNSANRSCTGGTETAYKTLTDGVNAAQPGDILLLRAGTYGQLAPSVSGIAGQPITIKNYPGETARIANLSGVVAINIIDRSDLIIEGLTIENVLGFGRLEGASRITLKGNTFKTATSTGTTSGLKLVRSSYNKILDNIFTDGNDIVIIQDNSDKNVLQSNTLTTARHSLISIRCSNNNVIRRNILGNPNQKAVEIYDCEGVSDAPVRLNATKRNLFEGNEFKETLASDRDYKYNAIQHGGQQTIVRNNLFRNCQGGGVNYQYYADESLYVYGNRLYNNTFYDNRCYGIMGNSGPGSQYYDNRVVNNLLYRNKDCGGSEGQTRINDPGSVILINNALATASPQFVNEAQNDFHLLDGSPFIDRGTFVTKTKAAGNGTVLAVLDAGYFFDGFGIPGELGDLIQLEGQANKARVLSIDYGTQTITLNQPLTWTSGQGVHLSYGGNAPDMGAFEYQTVEPGAPAPPKNLHIE